MYNMGREGVLPRVLGKTRNNVPVTALTVYIGFSLLVTLVLGLVWGPLTVYGFSGTILGIGIIVVYILINVSLFPFYKNEYPNELSIVRHLALPIIASLVMLLPLYGQLVPYPPAPINLAPMALAAWMVAGVAIGFRTRRMQPQTFQGMGVILSDL